MATSNSTTKVCTKCGVEYPATTEYFYADNRAKKLRNICKPCAAHQNSLAYREWYAKNKEKKLESNAQWMRENKEHRRSYEANYYQKKREHKLSWHKQWYIAHHEQQALYRQRNYEQRHAQDDLYRKNNRERIREQKARYAASHPNTARVATHRRRARERQLPDTFTVQEWQHCLDCFENKCAYCGKTEDFWTVLAADHWIAIRDEQGRCPGNVATNIVPACHARPGVPAGVPCCNNNKGNKDPIEWLEQRFGKRKAREIQKRIEAYFAWVRGQEDRPD